MNSDTFHTFITFTPYDNNELGGMFMNRKTLIMILCCIVSICSIHYLSSEIIAKKNRSRDDITLRYINSPEIKDIYTINYQEGVKDQVESYKSMDNYTIDNPLIIENPFGTNTTSLYLYFESEQPGSLTYNVHVEDEFINDYSQTLYNGEQDNLSNIHEYQLIGLIPDMKNEITLTLKDENETIISTKTFTYDMSSLLGDEAIILEKEDGTSQEALSNGLYTYMGLDSEEQDFIYLYDNDGIIRGEIPIIEYRSHRLLFDDEGFMYTSVSKNKIAKFDRLGQIVDIYNMDGYELHHDYVFDEDGNMLVLASIEDSETVEDVIIRINLDNHKVSMALDFNELMADYKKQTTRPKDSETLDWLHFNSIVMMENDSILLSSRETSTIMKIDEINTEPTIDYFIGEETFWEDTGYEDYLLQKDGDFINHGGQHSIAYVHDASLADGEYYLYFFNNNSGIANTRSDYDFSTIGLGKKNDVSMYTKYLVNENTRSYEFVDTIEVDYSAYVSSTQEIENNVIINSGQNFKVYEFDSNGDPIATFTIEGESFLYRCFKYNYQNFWFY